MEHSSEILIPCSMLSRLYLQGQNYHFSHHELKRSPHGVMSEVERVMVNPKVNTVTCQSSVYTNAHQLQNERQKPQLIVFFMSVGEENTKVG